MADDEVKKEHINAIVNEIKKDEHVKVETAAAVAEEAKDQEKKEEKKAEEKEVKEKEEEKKAEEEKKNEANKEPKKEQKKMKAIQYSSYGGGASALKVINHPRI